MCLRGPLLGDASIPPCATSTPSQGPLWACCDIPASAPRRKSPSPATIARARPGRAGGQGEAMAQVNTVRGPVDGGRLGRTLMHEHIFVLSPEIEKTAEEWDEAAEQARAVDEAARAQGARDRHPRRPHRDRTGPLHPAGGGDRRAGAGDQRRRGDRRLHLQRGPDVLPLPGSGDHPGGTRADGGPLRPRDPRGDRRDRRAGRHPQVRLRPSRASRPGVERVLRAVAQAHRATGVPITTHTPTPPEPWGLEQQRIFKEEGVDLTRVVIGHSGGTVNTDYHLQPDRQRLVSRLRPLRPARHHAGGARRRGGAPVRAGLRRADRALARRHVLRRLVPPLRDGRVAAAGAGPTSPTRCSRSCATAASARPTSPPCWWTTPAPSSRAAPRTDAPTRRPGMTLLQPELVAELAGAFPDARGVAEPGRRRRAHAGRVAPALQPSGPGPAGARGSRRATGSGCSSATTNRSSGWSPTWPSTRRARWPCPCWPGWARPSWPGSCSDAGASVVAVQRGRRRGPGRGPDGGLHRTGERPALGRPALARRSATWSRCSAPTTWPTSCTPRGRPGGPRVSWCGTAGSRRPTACPSAWLGLGFLSSSPFATTSGSLLVCGPAARRAERVVPPPLRPRRLDRRRGAGPSGRGLPRAGHGGAHRRLPRLRDGRPLEPGRRQRRQRADCRGDPAPLRRGLARGRGPLRLRDDRVRRGHRHADG